jgi:hypothetical protein
MLPRLTTLLFLLVVAVLVPQGGHFLGTLQADDQGLGYLTTIDAPNAPVISHGSGPSWALQHEKPVCLAYRFVAENRSTATSDDVRATVDLIDRQGKAVHIEEKDIGRLGSTEESDLVERSCCV